MNLSKFTNIAKTTLAIALVSYMAIGTQNVHAQEVQNKEITMEQTKESLSNLWNKTKQVSSNVWDKTKKTTEEVAENPSEVWNRKNEAIS